MSRCLLSFCTALASACLPTVPYDNTALPGPLYPVTVSSPSQPSPSTISPPEASPVQSTVSLAEVVITPSSLEMTVDRVVSSCPPAWTEFTSTSGYKKCYQQISGDFDYLGAKYDCQSRGGSIATVENAEEYIFLKAMCITGRTVYLESIPYIGLIRNDVVGHLKWEDSHNEGFLKFFKDIEPAKEEGNCFKFVTDQTISDGDLLHEGLAGYYTAVDCLHMSRNVLCQIIL